MATLTGQILPITYVPNPAAADGAPVELFTLNGSPVYTGDVLTVSATGIDMVFGGVGDPNGATTAPLYAVYSEYDGSGNLVRLWNKSVDGGNTGWI